MKNPLHEASQFFPQAYKEWLINHKLNERIEEYFNRIGYGFESTPDTIRRLSLKAFSQREEALTRKLVKQLQDDTPF